MAWKPDYVTLNAQKAYMHLDDTADDTELPGAITAAARAIDRACNRQFGQVDAAEERIYTARWDGERCRWIVDIDDLQDSTGLAILVNGTAITKYTLEPVNAVLEGKAWTRLVVGRDAETQPCGAENEISGTGLWGWADFPATVVHANKLQASRFHNRRDSPYGIAGSPDQGSELRLLARVDPDVAVMLADYRRRRKVG